MPFLYDLRASVLHNLAALFNGTMTLSESITTFSHSLISISLHQLSLIASFKLRTTQFVFAISALFGFIQAIECWIRINTFCSTISLLDAIPRFIRASQDDAEEVLLRVRLWLREFWWATELDVSDFMDYARPRLQVAATTVRRVPECILTGSLVVTDKHALVSDDSNWDHSSRPRPRTLRSDGLTERETALVRHEWSSLSSFSPRQSRRPVSSYVRPTPATDLDALGYIHYFSARSQPRSSLEMAIIDEREGWCRRRESRPERHSPVSDHDLRVFLQFYDGIDHSG